MLDAALHGEELSSFSQNAYACPLFAWPQQQIGSGGAISKIRGDFAFAHQSLEVEGYETADD